MPVLDRCEGRSSPIGPTDVLAVHLCKQADQPSYQCIDQFTNLDPAMTVEITGKMAMFHADSNCFIIPANWNALLEEADLSQ